MNIRFNNARLLMPAEGHTFKIVEGELWTKDDRIAFSGTTEEAKKALAENELLVWDEVIDCNRNLLMPGFKNAHTHTAMTFLRSLADDMPLSDWLFKQVFPREDKLTPEDVYWLDFLGIMEYLTSGITSNFDMYFFPPMNAKASVDAGFRTVQTSGFNNFGSTLQDLEDNYNIVNDMDSDLVSFIVGFHAEYTTAMDRMEGVAALAEKFKSPVFLHNAETKSEVDECIERWGKTPTQLTDSLDMYKYGGGGYHCVWMDDKDFEIFKNRGLYAVTNPGSNTKLASGIAPITRYLKEGINLALGTDGPASNNCLDMFREMFLMTGLAKLREMDAATVPAEEVLYAATCGGAHAMSLEDCDSLEVGKKADLILIDLFQPNMQPENNIVKNIVYSGSKQNVKLTMVNGKVLYESGKFDIGFDPKEIYTKANGIIGRMK
jgi:5-methylthioadenosine/S-adenosylhomocysteine deaminase